LLGNAAQFVQSKTDFTDGQHQIGHESEEGDDQQYHPETWRPKEVGEMAEHCVVDHVPLVPTVNDAEDRHRHDSREDAEPQILFVLARHDGDLIESKQRRAISVIWIGKEIKLN
jgi:hypothetical protein